MINTINKNVKSDCKLICSGKTQCFALKKLYCENGEHCAFYKTNKEYEEQIERLSKLIGHPYK